MAGAVHRLWNAGGGGACKPDRPGRSGPLPVCLYSDMDAAVGHYRRYTRAELVGKLDSAGFAPVACRYADSIGFAAALAFRLGRRSGGARRTQSGAL